METYSNTQVGDTVTIDGITCTVTNVQDFGSLRAVSGVALLEGDEANDPSLITVFIAA